MTRIQSARRRSAGAAAVSVMVMAVAAIGTYGPVAWAEPTGRVLNSGFADTVPERYIVVLRDARLTAAEVRAAATELVREYGGEVRYTYVATVHGFSAQMSQVQAGRLATDPSVAYVQPSVVYHAADVQHDPPSWGLDRIDQRQLPLDDIHGFPTTGAGVTAFVIDSGIRLFPEFDGRASHGGNFVPLDPNPEDCNGHGTAVAAILGGTDAFSVAKRALIESVRVLDCAGVGDSESVLAGVEYVTGRGVSPAVANMSLVGPPGVRDQALEDGITASIAAGVTYVTAAGNDNADACDYVPANLPGIITVGSTTSTDSRAPTSNYGTCVDIFAPGQNITTLTYQPPRTPPTPGPPYSAQSISPVSGTSFAAPLVAGLAALILARNPTFTPAQVTSTILGLATPGQIIDPGAGSPNLLLHTWPGIVEFSCEDRPVGASCEVHYLGVAGATIRWEVFGNHNSGMDNDWHVTIACVTGQSVPVTVEVTHPLGFVDARSTAFTCSPSNR